MSAAYYPQVQKIYVAYYGRPADPAGLQYWAGQLAANGGSLTAIINAFGNSAESTALYAGADNAAKVTAIYQQLFNRSPDSAGLAFYVNELSLGRMTAASIALNVANGATGTDATYLTNKQAVASSFTDALTTDSAAAVAYAGTAAANTARALISGVTTSAATTNVASTIAAIKPGGGAAATGQTFTLTTTANETVAGTTKSESFVGLVSSDSTKTTFNSTDVITDPSSADSDTLTLTLANDVAAADTATIRNVENIVLNLDASTTAAVLGGATANEFYFPVTSFSGVKTYTVDVTRAVTGVNDVLLDDVEDESTVTFSTDFSNAEVTVETAGDDVSVAMLAAGTTGTPVVLTLTAGTAPGDVTATGAGDLSVVATTATGIVNATAQKGLRIDSAAALVVKGAANGGNLTVSNADAAVIVDVQATGDISVTDSGAGSVKAVAGGTVTLAAVTGFGATSVNLSSIGTSTIVGGAVTAATLSGNGAKVTYAATASPLVDVTIAGSNDVTLQVSGTVIDAATDVLSINDASTGIFTLEVSGAGSVDLRNGSLIDRLEIDANMGGGGDTLSVKSGQAVVYTITQTASTVAVGSAAAESTNNVTIVLDDESRASGTVSFTGLTVTQAKTVTIDASVDTTSGGTANTSTISGLTASGANSNVTVNGGVNGITFAGTNTTGTGTLTITSSGPVDFGTATLTASALDASGVSGAITGTTLDLQNVNTITTGSGADTMTLAAGAATSFTVKTGAGNDTITMPARDFGTANALSFDFGDGTDTLVLVNGTKLTAGTGGSISVAGLENITVNATSTTQTIQASVLNGATYAIKASAASANGDLVVNVASTDTAIDLSKLVMSEAVDSSVTGMDLTVDASGVTGAISVTGSGKMKNSIEGGSGADTLVGGTLNDTFIYDTDALLFNSSGGAIDTITGGAGNADIIRVGDTVGTAVTIANTDSFANITGIERIVSAAITAGATIALDVTAETAGINRVDLSAAITTANSINVSEYVSAGVTILGSSTVVDTITGGGGADTITGGGGADIIDAGAGNDSLIYLLTADLFATQAAVDSITGGTGTDVLTVGTSGTAFAVADDDEWTRISGVETIKAVANTAAVTIDVDVTAWAAGLRTIDVSAGTAATGNVVKADEIVGGGMTLIGSATGATEITGGDGADTITGGVLVDTIVGGAGADQINFASTAALNGNDIITATIGSGGDVFNFSAFLGTSSYQIVGNSTGSTAITATQDDATGNISIANRLAILEVAAADAATMDTVAELFAVIDGAGDAFELTSGKAVVIVDVLGAADGQGDAVVYYIDTALDGAAGLSTSDIVAVGTLANMSGSLAAGSAFVTTNFM